MPSYFSLLLVTPAPHLAFFLLFLKISTIIITADDLPLFHACLYMYVS